jgi:hypothetical protein
MGFQGRSIDIAAFQLKSGRGVRLRATGQSMKPLLPPGCLLRIEPMTEPPEMGDIVLYQSEGGRLVSHRVIALTSEGIQTKGDAFVSADGAVGLSQVLGKVVAVEEPFCIPLEGRFMRWTGRVLGFVYPKLYRLKMAFCKGSIARPSRACEAPDV